MTTLPTLPTITFLADAAFDDTSAAKRKITEARIAWTQATRPVMRAAVGPEAAAQLYCETCAKAEELADLASQSDDYEPKAWFLTVIEFVHTARLWACRQGARELVRDEEASFAWGEALMAKARIEG